MIIHNKSFSGIFTVLLLTTAICGCGGQVKSNRQQSGSPGASITDIEGIEVVSLYGSWEEMGRQFGELAGGHLRHIYDGFLMPLIAGDESKLQSVKEVSEKLVSKYPDSYKDFFKGAAETSGLSYGALIMVNAVEYAEGFFCSGIAAWGDYSRGSLVYGRNYDAASYRPIAEDVIVTVFHPADGSIPTAIVGYAGELYAVNAFNRSGIFMELNNGMPSAGYNIDFERIASTTSLLEMMFEAENIDFVDNFLQARPSFASFIIGVADANEARAYEWCASGVKRADALTPDGLMVMTNHYVHPAWDFPTPSDEKSWNSLVRREHLLAQAEARKGNLGAEEMRALISTPIEDGGARHYLTRYQIVCEPAAMTLHIKVEDGQWAVLDMTRFF